MGKTTIKDWEEWKLYKSRRSLHVYWYTLRFKFSLHFKQLNLEITNATADLYAQTKGLVPPSRLEDGCKLIWLKY